MVVTSRSASSQPPGGRVSPPVPRVTDAHAGPDAPLGATLGAGGATFRVWAPAAKAVYLKLNDDPPHWRPASEHLLTRDSRGVWSGFVAGVEDGARYRYYVVGEGGEGFKRDPYARELAPGWPECDCVVRDPDSYPWHDAHHRTPDPADLVIYELHVGTFYAFGADGTDRRVSPGATFLDLIERIPYLAALGVNAIEPLPLIEFATRRSMGYNGVDLFAPEMRYEVAPADLDVHLQGINRLLAARGHAPLQRRHLESQVNQLKAMIDLCHVYGLAVILDVVYNHAGGGFHPDKGFDDQGLYFFDFQPPGDNNRSLYFTDQGWAGGLVFAYWKDEVRRYLIDNARFFLREYHVDGLRYDEVTVIDDHGGWRFCQELTAAARSLAPRAVQVAEYWRPDPSWAVRQCASGGAGFDAVWSDRLCIAVRGALAQAAGGGAACVNLDPVCDALGTPPGFARARQAVHCLENHDLVYAGHQDRQPRIARLGDARDPQSWFARSRARVANGLLMTAPGIPMLFMGQEFLEEEPWSDRADRAARIGWMRLQCSKVKQDFLAYMRALSWLRRRHPALRSDHARVTHVHNANRVIAYRRWADQEARDVVVVATLCETTYPRYALGFPLPGRWLEVLNSDQFDNHPNAAAAHNGGAVHAAGPPLHGLPTSAGIVIPANGLVVFARDRGDEAP